MSLSLYSPFFDGSLARTNDDWSLLSFDHPFFAEDDFFFNEKPFRTLSKQAVKQLQQQEQQLQPLTRLLSADLVENENEFKVLVDLPGVDPQKDLEITLNNKNNVLTLKAERQHEREEKNDKNKVHYTERSYGSVQRSIRLPKNADLDGAQTHFNNGVLTVTFPKLAPVAPVGPRKLKINVVNNNAANKSGDSNNQTDKNENNKEVASTASNEETVPPNTPAVTTEAAVEAHGAEKRENASTSANTNKTTTTSSTSPTSVAATATTAKAALGGSPIVKQSSVDGVEDVVF